MSDFFTNIVHSLVVVPHCGFLQYFYNVSLGSKLIVLYFSTRVLSLEGT